MTHVRRNIKRPNNKRKPYLETISEEDELPGVERDNEMRFLITEKDHPFSNKGYHSISTRFKDQKERNNNEDIMERNEMDWSYT